MIYIIFTLYYTFILQLHSYSTYAILQKPYILCKFSNETEKLKHVYEYIVFFFSSVIIIKLFFHLSSIHSVCIFSFLIFSYALSSLHFPTICIFFIIFVCTFWISSRTKIIEDIVMQFTGLRLECRVLFLVQQQTCRKILFMPSCCLLPLFL